jgi:hypothetical protein
MEAGQALLAAHDGSSGATGQSASSGGGSNNRSKQKNKPKNK